MTRLLCLCALFLTSLPGLAAEQILHFHSHVQIHANGSMTVTETIRVKAEGKQIRRGIYRDFPTTYKTARGRRHKVDFRVIDVRRNGKPEAWHTQRLSNGTRVYFGRSAVFIKPGIHTYRFTYYTHRQIGFFDTHDELYWNTTGHGWGFPIQRATARIQLPETLDAGALKAEAYTGRYGDRGQDWDWQPLADGARFQAGRALTPREGLTVVLQWPKGLVPQPTRAQQLRWLWQDDAGLIILWGGSALVLLYYLLAWLRVGRDPAAGVIMPLYEPPAGYSPAALRLIRQMAYDDKALSASLVHLAVQGALTLQERDDEYTILKQGEDFKAKHDEEHAILDGFGSRLTFENTNHEKVSDLIRAHKESLTSQFQRRYYYANRGWIVPGALLSLGVLGFAGWQLLQSYGVEALIFIFMSAFATAFIGPFFMQLWRMRLAWQRSTSGWVRLSVTAMPALFFSAMLMSDGFIDFFNIIPWPTLMGGVTLIIINLCFYQWIKAPTQRGRALLDQVEGFRQYLSLAEGDELRQRYSQPLTPETFEAFLPYAIALDVENAWSERFASELRRSGQSPSSYRSHWYDGSDFRGVRGICSSVSSSFTASVSSASSPPGSSSGGGGGGFSGGGGGGGGGGGW